MHEALQKRWIEITNSERLYLEDIAKYEEHSPNEQ
jgi:hypothetical protein